MSARGAQACAAVRLRHVRPGMCAVCSATTTSVVTSARVGKKGGCGVRQLGKMLDGAVACCHMAKESP